MTTPSEHNRKTPSCAVSHGVWWVVVGLGVVTVLALAVYLIGLWLLVFDLLGKVAVYVVVAVSIATVGGLAWHQRRRFFTKLRFSLRSLLVLQLLGALGLWIVYWVPRSQTLSYNDSHIGCYRGLGLTEGTGYIGKNWFRIVAQENGTGGLANELLDGYWEVDLDGLGYNQYRNYYATGAIRFKGLCMVVENGPQVRPDRTQLWSGKSYDPNGKLISEVKDGDGKQILCFSNGQRHFEADFVDGKWSGTLKIWYRNGRLHFQGQCRNGTQHGAFTMYYANGRPEYEGEYKDGEATGIWVHYAENGEVASRIEHGTPVGAEPTMNASRNRPGRLASLGNVNSRPRYPERSS